jgi:hypothetical protein
MTPPSRAAVAASWLLLAGCGVAVADAGRPTPDRRAPVSDCTRTLGPADAARLAAVVDELPSGATLCLQPGRYPARLVVGRGLTLVGLGAAPDEVVLDAEFQSRALTVTADEAVTVRNVTFENGLAPEGGAVMMEGKAPLTLERCVLRRNKATGTGGGAVYVRRGQTTLQRCRVLDNLAPLGGGAMADIVADLTLSDTLVAGNRAPAGAGLAARDDARLVAERVTVADNEGESAVEVVANARRAPEVRLRDAILAGRAVALSGSEAGAGKVSVVRSVVSGALKGAGEATGNREGAPAFTKAYRPAKGSPAVGLAEAPAGATDLDGTPRPASGATAGALEAER